MIRHCILICLMAYTLSTFSQQTDPEKYPVEVLEISSPDFEWTQFDNDNAECKFRKNYLALESKKNGMYACTIAELDFNANQADFILVYQFEPDGLKDNSPLGIVFDYKNIKNFQTLCFGKKQFQLVSYEGGEKAVVKEGLYKLKGEKKLLVTMVKKGSRIDFYLGNQNLPLTTLRKSEVQYSNVGYYVDNKAKMKVTGFGYRLLLSDEDDTDE